MNKTQVNQFQFGRKKKVKQPEAPMSTDVSMSLENTLYEIMIGDAKEKFYINEAEKPAWLILDKYSILTTHKNNFELWFSTIHCFRFRTLHECHEKIKEMVSKARVPMKVYMETKKGERTLFATKEMIAEAN